MTGDEARHGTGSVYVHDERRAGGSHVLVSPTAPPTGYRFVPARPGVLALARDDAAAGVREVLGHGTLDGWASAHPERRAMRGRGLVHAVPLPAGGPRVVVRHARHGGLLASLTGDRFLRPRADHELRTALRLAELGVPTPAVVAYALYSAGRLLQRADVATGEIAGGLDLPDALERWPDARASILAAVGTLLDQLARAGARHPDLNVKNVLITRDGPGGATAHVLDVDRIVFGRPGDPALAAANAARLLRSARKWAARGRPLASETELAALSARTTDSRGIR